MVTCYANFMPSGLLGKPLHEAEDLPVGSLPSEVPSVDQHVTLGDGYLLVLGVRVAQCYNSHRPK